MLPSRFGKILFFFRFSFQPLKFPLSHPIFFKDTVDKDVENVQNFLTALL